MRLAEVKSASGCTPETWPVVVLGEGSGLVWVQLEGMGLPMGPPARGRMGLLVVRAVRIVARKRCWSGIVSLLW